MRRNWFEATPWIAGTLAALCVFCYIQRATGAEPALGCVGGSVIAATPIDAGTYTVTYTDEMGNRTVRDSVTAIWDQDGVVSLTRYGSPGYVRIGKINRNDLAIAFVKEE